MRVASSSFTNGFLYETNQLQNTQNQLQAEASSGLKLTLPEDDPSGMANVLNLQTNASANQQYQANITDLQSQASAVSQAITGLQSLTSQASEIATSADGTTTPQELSTYATQVSNLIQQALAIANTQDSDGNYIFGGTNTGAPPFVATTDSSGNITGVTYNGNSNVIKSEISQGVTVTAQIPGENNSGSGPAGLFANSSTGADLFNHLISLQQNLQSGNTTAISSTDAPNLTKDENNVLDQISTNGVLQSRLQAASSIGTQQGNALTSQISNDTNADLATTITKLQQTQTAFQAALETGTMVMSISLVNYLT
jgi:flagellar hook-associated protein 3 FlgL